MIDTTTDKAQYDECAKKLLSFKAIDAWILKKCTKEFKEFKRKRNEKYFKQDRLDMD